MATAEELFWIVLEEGVEPVRWTRRAVASWIASNYLAPRVVQLCPDGGREWGTADAFGFACPPPPPPPPGASGRPPVAPNIRPGEARATHITPPGVAQGAPGPPDVAAVPPPAPPLKWHGGKNYLARRIISLMPRHLHFVEPFAGGLAVLLARDPADRRLWVHEAPPAHLRGVSEVANDIDLRLTNFWRVLQRPETFERFCRVVQAVPFSEAEWGDADGRLDHPDPVERAVAFFVRCRMSLAGRRDAFAGVSRTRTRGGRNEQVNAWWGAVEGLPAVAWRLRDVLVLSRPALDVIRQHDMPHTLFYCDPPYLHSTRTDTAAYEHEMTEADHRELLAVLKGCEGRVMLSGYPSALYDRELAGWARHTFDLANHAAGGDGKRRMTECLWCNYEPPEAGEGPDGL